MNNGEITTVKQHYVPQSYLKRFTDQSEGLWVFDKTTLLSFKSNPRQVAFEKLFYEIDPTCLADDTVPASDFIQVGERALAAMESVFSRVTELITQEGRYVGIDPALMEDLSLAVVIQWLRTPHSRNLIIQLLESNLNHMSRRLIKLNFPGGNPDLIRVEMKQSHHAALHLKALFDPDRWRQFGLPLLTYSWVLGIAPQGLAFATCDHPVIRVAHDRSSSLPGTGFRSPGIEVLYPLSSQMALMIFEPSYHQEWARLHRSAVTLTSDSVARINDLAARAARRFVFSANGDFARVQALCEAEPQYRDPNRQRVRTVNIGKVATRKKLRRERFLQVILDDVSVFTTKDGLT